MEKTKKAFQRVIANIRKETESEFPKAMMTSQQMNKCTATVNCGGERYSTESSKELAEKVLNDKRFLTFLEKNKAAAAVEAVSIGDKMAYQVRILFDGYGREDQLEAVEETNVEEAVESAKAAAEEMIAKINEEPKAEAEAPAKKSSRKGPRATYIFYYTDKNDFSSTYEACGTHGFYDALKFMHSDAIKATRIEIYKQGPNFASDHNDKAEAHKKYWK